MTEQLFSGLFQSSIGGSISIAAFLICLSSALLTGFLLAIMYCIKNRFSTSYLTTLAILPAVVCVVILIVNGNIGTGIAVAGTFSLVRFRSAPGTAEEIGGLFLAMAAGLILGAGYIAYAFIFTLLMGSMGILYRTISQSKSFLGSRQMSLSITIPEDLNYTEVFEESLNTYTSFRELVSVKTTNLGSLFRLTYRLTLRESRQEKELIDQLRCLNGNLEIMISQQSAETIEL